MPATALPAEFPEADVVGQDVDDVGLLAETLFESREPRVDLFVLGRPRFAAAIGEGLERGVELLGDRRVGNQAERREHARAQKL